MPHTHSPSVSHSDASCVAAHLKVEGQANRATCIGGPYKVAKHGALHRLYLLRMTQTPMRRGRQLSSHIVISKVRFPEEEGTY
jgi:hypothetical protein